MAVNADKPHKWKSDIAQSVDMYNNWFIRFAPKTYRDTRMETAERVKKALEWTSNLTNVESQMLREHPSILSILRMATAPPLARDRLIGLARVEPNLVDSMETEQRLPPKMEYTRANSGLRKIGELIMQLADKDIFTWLEDKHIPGEVEIYRASTIVADRLCGAETNPILRNAQEQRQLKMISEWLIQRGYTAIGTRAGLKFSDMTPGTFAFRLNVPVTQEDRQGNKRQVNIPIDTVIMSRHASPGDFPLLIEAKSAGDFTNTNKRRKEEATKISQLQRHYGMDVRFIMFLCGYFDTGYLGYEAAEGIDWVWEHRIDDLAEFGV